MCSPGQFGKCLRNTPYPLILGHTLSGCSVETQPAWVTLPLPTLPLARPPVSLEIVILHAQGE
jgi:hypothetical protein